MTRKPYRPPEERLAEMQESETGPIRDTISNFQLAKELHRQNLDHNPLPDKICHTQYQRMQMLGEGEPGLALEEGNYASGEQKLRRISIKILKCYILDFTVYKPNKRNCQ